MLSRTGSIDTVGLNERVARFNSRSIKKESKVHALKLALSMCDLTTLEGKDTEGKVRQMCAKARVPMAGVSGLPSVAAVCVYPPLVRVAKASLVDSGVKVAAVATAFPSGLSSLALRVKEVAWTVKEGADEIDMVISRGKFLSGNYRAVHDEIVAVKEACGEAHLKVILETGELATYDQVRHASFLAMQAGADFIKTSTGKVQPAATLPVTLVMLEAIRDFYYETGKRVGMKPAGGVANAKLAIQYLVMLNETLGEDWMNPDLFRFGASALVNDLLRQLEKERTGRYQSFDYFSKD